MIHPDCDHQCISNCRRVGCNCLCGEFHEHYEPMEEDVIRKRLETLSTVAYFVDRDIIEKVQLEDIEAWGKSPAPEQKMSMDVLCNVKESPFISLTAFLP